MADIVQNDIITVTPLALTKVRSLMEEKQLEGYGLRVFVAGGGCSGFQYGMAFENNIQESDTVLTQDGVKVIVDPVSYEYIIGATIDFVDNLMGGGFRIDNPNAVSTCGCGSSFRTKDGKGAPEEAAGGCGTCSTH
ncbi:MAG: iron-sulfur cluster insertion protein ErpA [Chloroflexi bacterium]|nr:iron-sulfur cluster insertion protein ErpA [Chloroflexota bacterium]